MKTLPAEGDPAFRRFVPALARRGPRGRELWVLSIRDRTTRGETPILVCAAAAVARRRRLQVLDDLLLLGTDAFRQRWMSGRPPGAPEIEGP